MASWWSCGQLVLSYCGSINATHEEIVQSGVLVTGTIRTGKAGKIYNHTAPPTGNRIILLDPEKLKYVLDRLVLSHQVILFLHTTLVAVKKRGSHLEAIDLVGLFQQRSLSGKAFVDARNGQLSKFTGLPAVFISSLSNPTSHSTRRSC